MSGRSAESQTNPRRAEGERLTSKQRLLLAINNQVPDRVPCSPDLMRLLHRAPANRDLRPLYRQIKPPLFRAYLQVCEMTGIDGWFADYVAEPALDRDGDISVRWRMEEAPDGSLHGPKHVETAYGAIDICWRFTADGEPHLIERPLKDLAADLPAWLAWRGEVADVDVADWPEAYAECGQRSIVGVTVEPGGLHALSRWLEGDTQAALRAAADTPGLVDEWVDHHNRNIARYVELLLGRCEPRPDFFLLSASGLTAMHTEAQVRRWAMPAIDQITALCRQAGVPTMVHCSGPSRRLLQMLADETALDCYRPLEGPPEGDCDLAEVKRELGGKLALMGNLSVELLRSGSAEQVRQASRQAIDAAAAGGGFILAGGDKCHGDTPLANIAAMLDACREHGRYD